MAQIVPVIPAKIVNNTIIPTKVTPLGVLAKTKVNGKRITPRVVAVIPQIRLNIDNVDFFIKLFLCEPIIDWCAVFVRDIVKCTKDSDTYPYKRSTDEKQS